MGHLNADWQTIRTDFGLSGVDMSGARIRTEETSLWAVKNCVVDQRGALRKRNKYLPIGNPIYEPTPAAADAEEMVSINIEANPEDWLTDERVPDNVHVTPQRSGIMSFYGSTNGAGTSGIHRVKRMVKSGESYNTFVGSNKDFTVGFSFRSNELFRIPISMAITPGLHLGFAAYADSYINVALSHIGLAIDLNGTGYTAVPGTESLDDGLLHTVEIRVFYTPLGTRYNAYTYIDGVAMAGSVSSVSGLQSASGQFVDIAVINAGSLPSEFLCAGHISNIYLRDNATAPSDVARIEEVFSRRKYREDAHEPDIRAYAATSESLWYDENMSGIWRFGGVLPYPRTYTADFRDTVILLSSGNARDTQLTQIRNDYTTRILDDAPNIRFASTYSNRLWGAGDSKYPLRLYFSADRDPNSWFSPDTDADGQESIDEVLGAGYFELQGDSGDAITAVYGDFLGSIIATTRTRTYRIVGNSLETWQVQLLSSTVGAFGPHSIERAGNDLWIAGDGGILSLRGVQEYGDMATASVSVQVHNLFAAIGTKPQAVHPLYKDRTRLVFDRTRNEVTLLLMQPEDYDDIAYVFRLDSGKWLGPIEDNITALSADFIGVPTHRSMLRGSSDGVVSYATTMTDMTCTSTVESQVLNGRSVSPAIVGMEKTWKALRIIANPTGNVPITISVKVEDYPWETHTRYLAPSTGHFIGDTWEVSASEVHDADEMHVVDIKLNQRGKTMKYKIECASEEMSLVASEVAFTIDGFEKGD